MDSDIDKNTDSPDKGAVERDWAKIKKNLSNKIENTRTKIIERPLPDDGARTIIDIDKNRNNTLESDASIPSLLASDNRQSDLVSQDDTGPDTNAIAVFKALSEGALTPEQLRVDERRILIRFLMHQGKTEDEMAAVVGVSRRTIVNDKKWLREQTALELAAMDTLQLGAQIYDTAQAAIHKALAGKKLRTVSIIMRDMVEMLQSLGLMHRAPRTQKNLSLVGSVNLGQSGFQRYMDTVGDNKEQVVMVFDELMKRLAPTQLE